MHKLHEKVALASGLVALSVALAPLKANAFQINRPITGVDSAGRSLGANISIKRGAEAGLDNNQLKWVVKLIEPEAAKTEDDLGFKSFGFNFTDRLAGKVKIAGLDENWTVRGKGDGKARLSGQDNIKFDYVYAAKSNRFKSDEISFIATFSDGDDATVDSIIGTDITDAYFSNAKKSALSGQAAAHIIGLADQKRGAAIAGEVPTPALLPGLIGMGVAAFRKRKQSQDELQEG